MTDKNQHVFQDETAQIANISKHIQELGKLGRKRPDIRLIPMQQEPVANLLPTPKNEKNYQERLNNPHAPTIVLIGEGCSLCIPLL